MKNKLYKGVKINGEYYGIDKKIKTISRDGNDKTMYILEKPYSSELTDINLAEFKGTIEFVEYEDVRTKDLKLNEITDIDGVTNALHITATLSECDNGCVIGEKTIDVSVPFERVVKTIFIKLNESSFINNARRVDLLLHEIYSNRDSNKFKNKLEGVKTVMLMCASTFRAESLNELFNNRNGYVLNTDVSTVKTQTSEFETCITYNLIAGSGKFKVEKADYHKWLTATKPVEFKISNREGTSINARYDHSTRNITTVFKRDGELITRTTLEDASDLVKCILSDLYILNLDGGLSITMEFDPSDYSNVIFKDLESEDGYSIRRYIRIDEENERPYMCVECSRAMSRIKK